MDEKKEKRQNIFAVGIRKLFSRDILIFLVFLFIAFIFWYFNYLRKETEFTFRLQLEYVNPPSGSVITNNSSSAVYLNLSGQGYSLLKFSIPGKNRKLLIDLSTMRRQKKLRACNSDGGFFMITERVLEEYLKKASSADIKVLSVKPDTLFLFLEKESSTGIAE